MSLVHMHSLMFIIIQWDPFYCGHIVDTLGTW